MLSSPSGLQPGNPSCGAPLCEFCQLPLQVAELFSDAAEALEAKQAGAVRQGAVGGEAQLWATVQADGHSQSVASRRPGYAEQYPILSSILTVDLAVARDAKTAKASSLQLPVWRLL